MLPAGYRTQGATPGKLNSVVVARDRWCGRAPKQGAARSETVVEEEDALQQRMARVGVIAPELDGCPHAVAGTAGVVSLSGFRAPFAPTPSCHKLSAPDPALFVAVGAWNTVHHKQVPEDQEIMTGHAVCGDHSMGIDERIVLHNPECHMVLWFDGVISNVFECVSSNFKSEACSFNASDSSETLITECRANAIVCIKDLIVRNPDITEDIPGHEQGPIQRPPEMMVHDTPRYIRPDAHGAIPIVVDVT